MPILGFVGDAPNQSVNSNMEMGVSAFEALCKRVDDLQAERDRLKAALEKEEREHLETIQQRDHFEDILTNLADVAGCEQEWTNLHEHGECIEAKIQSSQDACVRCGKPKPCPEHAKGL